MNCVGSSLDKGVQYALVEQQGCGVADLNPETRGIGAPKPGQLNCLDELKHICDAGGDKSSNCTPEQPQFGITIVSIFKYRVKGLGFKKKLGPKNQRPALLWTKLTVRNMGYQTVALAEVSQKRAANEVPKLEQPAR